MLQFDEMDQIKKLKYIINTQVILILKFLKKFFHSKANIYLGKTYSPKINFVSPMKQELSHFFNCIKKKKGQSLQETMA